MADNLSPLVNLDLINQIYKTINAQITERVYDPEYNSKATLGSEDYKYVSAYIRDNTSTGTLNDLTLAKASAGFTISGGTTPKTLTVSDDLTISAATSIKKSLTVGTTDTGNVVLQSGGTGNTTIKGPSGGTAIFTAPTSSASGSLKIEGDSHVSTVSVASGKTISTRSNLTAGDSSNTGDITIKPKGAHSLTITSNDTKATTAILRDGTCVITDDYAESNTASKLVKRDGSNDIKVSSVNRVIIAEDSEHNTNKIDLSKGTASITATEAGLSVSQDLTVLAATTLGGGGTGDITVKSAGTGGTTIVGPSNGIVTFTTPAKEVLSSLEIANSDNSIKSIIRIASGKAVDTYTNLNIGDTTNSGSVTIKPTGAKATTIIGPEGTATLASGVYTSSVTLDNSDTPSTGKLLKIKNIAAKLFLAGPATGDETAPDFRSIVATDLPDDLTGSNAASADKVKTKLNETTDAKHYVSFIDSNNENASAEFVYTDSKLTYNPSTGTLGATKLAGELGASNIAGTLGVEHGGTGISSFTAGDILYASDTTTLSVLSKGDKGQVLKMGENSPTWGTDNTPTTFKWIDGDTEGPKGSLSGDGMTAIDFAAIPSAGESTSGVVTIGKQSFKGVKTFIDETDSNAELTAGAVVIKGGLSVAKNIYAAAVHNAVWNDLVDCMEVPENTFLEYGYCYSWEGTSVIKSSRSSKNCIGIHSNTAGFAMGEKKTKTIRAAVAGFVLAYVDKIYPEGTPLTWGNDGVLTKCRLLKRVLHPERIIATFYREEKEEKWHDLPVSGRHWVKVR